MMTSILEFCLDGCLDQDAGDAGHNESGSSAGSRMMSIRHNVMNRSAVGAYYSPQVSLGRDSNVQLEESNGASDRRNLLNERETDVALACASDPDNSAEMQTTFISYLSSFKFTNFKKIGSEKNTSEKKSQLDSTEQEGYAAPPSNDVDDNIESTNVSRICLPCDQESTLKETETILYEASSFNYNSQDSLLNIPSIPENSFIMPGSDIQKQMALSFQNVNIGQCEDECVICLDSFTPDNPRMPTMCGCGKDKTYFHLPCLYQWTEKDKNCPSCREELHWDEF